MEMIGAYEAQTHLAKLLERGEPQTITRQGKPVAQFIPVTSGRQHAQQATARVVGRRRHLKKSPLAELMATIHEGNRY